MAKRFSKAIVAACEAAKIIGIRAGAKSDHRFTGAWPVVVNGRLYARSWTLTTGGWYRTFLADPLGVIQVGDRELRVRAVKATSERVRDAVDAAYAKKYPTRGSQKYVRGFRTPRRRDATIEFQPK